MSLPLVIVPVFNAVEYLETCLHSLAQTIPLESPVLLIDDASTDARVRPLLQSWVNEAAPYRQLLVHENNRGFVASANQGLKAASTDVVLLNSDTQVTTGWLDSLANCLASSDAIATATPWSNNGEIVSIPGFCQSNPVPRDPESIAEVISHCGNPGYPELPTAVGFCMAISFHAIRKIGFFDEDSFGLGYGEENDFCQRAIKAGFKNVLCDDAYVVHQGGASFGPLGLAPDEQSMQRLLAKHPDYLAEVTEFIKNDPLAARRQKILDCLERSAVGMR